MIDISISDILIAYDVLFCQLEKSNRNQCHGDCSDRSINIYYCGERLRFDGNCLIHGIKTEFDNKCLTTIVIVTVSF